jgi:putative spermidine/putrescine transport system ATP-binding protein
MHTELGITFIFVTHDQEEALTLSDRIAVFNDGVIEQVGTPTELYETPQTLFVAEFLGESNVFAGDLTTKGRFTGELFSAEVGAAAATRCGSQVAVVIRPERLVLGGPEARAAAGRPSVPAQVTDVRYLGSHNRVGLVFDDGRPGSAMQLVGDGAVPAPGSRVSVSWHPEHQSVVAAPNGVSIPTTTSIPVPLHPTGSLGAVS